ncbi:MAG: ribonuclease HII [Pseudomonadota bacterium]
MIGPAIAGVDEVGRGPLAGPVVAAAVILDPDHEVVGLADSKALSAPRREALCEELKACASAWSIGRAEVEEIDRLNIYHASHLAMRRAVAGLKMIPRIVMVDGKYSPDFGLPARAVIKGDAKVTSISAASIIAKVIRDAEMIALDEQFPDYGFAQHKGYPTKSHLGALARYGATPFHRRSFAPVKRVVEQTDPSGRPARVEGA